MIDMTTPKYQRNWGRRRSDRFLRWLMFVLLAIVIILSLMLVLFPGINAGQLPPIIPIEFGEPPPIIIAP